MFDTAKKHDDGSWIWSQVPMWRVIFDKPLRLNDGGVCPLGNVLRRRINSSWQYRLPTQAEIRERFALEIDEFGDDPAYR